VNSIGVETAIIWTWSAVIWQIFRRMCEPWPTPSGADQTAHRLTRETTSLVAIFPWVRDARSTPLTYG
jgi:hypothetical protein